MPSVCGCPARGGANSGERRRSTGASNHHGRPARVGPVTQSIELLLDDWLEAAVRAEWQALQQADLPSMARHTGDSNRPHITLAIAHDVPAPVEDALSVVAGRVPMPVRLGSPICFARRPGYFILVRSVIPTVPLLDIHAEVAQLVAGLPGTGSYLQPGSWTPHVTLASDVPGDQLWAALAVLSPMHDLLGHALAVRRWDSSAKRTWLLG